MEILINELSLSGQFASAKQFVNEALPPLLSLLKEVDNTKNVLYKKYDFYDSRVTKQMSIHDIFKDAGSRQYDEIRRFKSQLAGLFENPYWEDTQKHSPDCSYFYKDKNVCGCSLAEACERDKIVVSFNHPDFSIRNLSVRKENEEINLDNLFAKGHYTEIARQRGAIPFEEYCRKTFAGMKLDFSQIDGKEGFDLLKQEDEKLFFDGFRKFTELSWQQIEVDNGLDYKKYKNKSYFKTLNRQVYKFRISEKYRCFGYVEQGVFYVLIFDLTHKLSDEG
jgi:hypothetical protein